MTTRIGYISHVDTKDKYPLIEAKNKQRYNYWIFYKNSLYPVYVIKPKLKDGDIVILDIVGGDWMVHITS